MKKKRWNACNLVQYKPEVVYLECNIYLCWWITLTELDTATKGLQYACNVCQIFDFFFSDLFTVSCYQCCVIYKFKCLCCLSIIFIWNIMILCFRRVLKSFLYYPRNPYHFLYIGKLSKEPFGGILGSNYASQLLYLRPCARCEPSCSRLLAIIVKSSN